MDIEPPDILLSIQPLNFILSVLPFLVLIFLLMSSAFISGAEVAFFSLTRKQIETAKNDNAKAIDNIESLLKKPKKLLATILIANNFVNVAIIILSAYLSKKYLQFPNLELFGYTLSSQFFIEIVGITFLILLFGEIIPKVYASNKALEFSSFMARPMCIIEQIFSPLNGLLLNTVKFVENSIGKKKDNLSIDQISQALELTTDHNPAEDHESHKILEGIVSFGNTDVKQVMTPRVDLFTLKTMQKFNEIVELISESGYSRIPVYSESIDAIAGILYAKDLIPHLNQKQYAWTKLLRKPYFVPENKKLDDLLNDFKEKKVHMAIVVDEYGGTSGIISLEDVMEEIVGEISDEFDDEEITYSKINENNYTFEGKISLKDFYRICDIENPTPFENQKGEAETLAGFIIEVNKKFPKQRQKIIFDDYTFTIEALDKKRIRQIKVTKPDFDNDKK